MYYWVVQTNNKVDNKDIEGFRAAINNISGEPLVSNKDRSGKERESAAPVQFKKINHRLGIVILPEASLFAEWCSQNLHGLQIRVHSQWIKVELQDSVKSEQWNHSPHPYFMEYTTSNWIPLSSDNYDEHKLLCRKLGIATEIDPLTGKMPYRHEIRHPEEISYFESLLGEHIKTIAEMDEAYNGQEIKVRISSPTIGYSIVQTYHRHDPAEVTARTKLSGFTFLSNVPLSPHLGYGRILGIGFGMMVRTG